MRPRTSAPNNRQAGFTLIEVIVAMAILGLVLAALGLRGPIRSERLDATAAARELAGSLQLARSRAIAQNRTVAVVLGAGSYSLDGEAPRPLRGAVAASDRGAVAFAGNGSSSGGAIVLRAGSRQQAVRVDWLTGRVTVAEPP